MIIKQLTTSARAFLGGGHCRSYLAIEEETIGARAYMHEVPNGFDVNQPISRLDCFLNQMNGIADVAILPRGSDTEMGMAFSHASCLSYWTSIAPQLSRRSRPASRAVR
ncbi:hypothetical protein HZZ16_23120 [Bradyrhizobium sp. CNPSo 4016]|nr:hypothetical protein [Bradyrhizobium glycinis]MBH5370991.1 hypothetical protein [Bradyrhizobium glycinis]